jgi:uncharacterized protein YcfL
MKKLLIVAASLGLLSACSSTSAPPKAVEQELVIDKHVQPLSRNEVIVGVRECETNGLRGVMLYGKRKINGYTTDVVVDVTCAPKW